MRKQYMFRFVFVFLFSFVLFLNRASNMPGIDRYLSIFHEACIEISSGESAGNKIDKVPSVRELNTTFS